MGNMLDKSEKESFLKKNRGFSLIELIIVIAIMAILAGSLAPMLVRYIKKSRRSVDVDTAGKIQSVFTAAVADYDANTSIPGYQYTYSVAWNKTASMPNPANKANWTIADYVFSYFNDVPVSKTNEDYFFMVDYDIKSGEVSKIQLVTKMGPGGKCYELWPDSSKFLSMTD